MKPLLLLLACTTILACTSDLPVDMPSDSGDLSATLLQRPAIFKATLRGGSPPPAPSSSCGGLLLTQISGEGVGTHLGRFTAFQQHCLDPTTFTFSNGVLEYTAANGNKLLGTYSGFLSPTPDPTVVTITGEFEFAGGTGRFLNATGSGDAAGALDVTTGDFTLVLDGRLSY